MLIFDFKDTLVHLFWEFILTFNCSCIGTLLIPNIKPIYSPKFFLQSL